MLTKELFLRQYPKADMNAFEFNPMGVDFIYKRKKYPIYKLYIGGPRYEYTGNLNYELNIALGVNNNDDDHKNKQKVSNNIGKYTLNFMTQYKHLPWDDKPKLYDFSNIELYITPTEKVLFKFRDVFKNSTLTFRTASESQRWVSSPNLEYFSQALNFAVYLSTTLCGVTRDLLTDNQVGSFYRFHVYFTIRRILNELQSPLPNDKLYSWNKNFYNKAAYQRLLKEFNCKLTDFRYLGGKNHGLGTPYARVYKGRISAEDEDYTPYKSSYQLHDEWDHDSKIGPDEHMNHFEIEFLNDDRTSYQYQWFFVDKSQGLTKAGLSRINQSIEAYVYCILGAQAQSRNSIIGNNASAIETRDIFLKLFESAVVENDISKSIQRYQFALIQAKQKLDLCVAYSCWLLPSDMVINTAQIQGYNNKLQKSTDNMKIGINDINNDIIQIKKHNMDTSKTKLPHQNIKPDINIPDTNNTVPDKPIIKPSKQSQTHDNNLTIITICSAAIAWYLFR